MSGPFNIGSDTWPGASRVIEEAGELLQVLGKLIGTGGENTHYDGSDLRSRLEEEIADVHAALAYFVEQNHLAQAEIDDRSSRKLAQYRAWHRERTEPA